MATHGDGVRMHRAQCKRRIVPSCPTAQTSSALVPQTANSAGVAASITPGTTTEFQLAPSFGDGSDNCIENVRVIGSAYHGISVLHNRDTSVRSSVVDAACTVLTDYGGIYTGARDQLPLNLRIEGNTVSNVEGKEGIAIYLDDSANGVVVINNELSHNTRGITVHNGFNNLITQNASSGAEITHLVFSQDGAGSIYGNEVTENTFASTRGEQTYNLEVGSNLKTFATYDRNSYTSTNPDVFARIWDGSSPGVTLSYDEWKAYSGQDFSSTMNGAP